MNDEEAFFSKYSKAFEKPKGIPGLVMNANIFTGMAPSGSLGLELEMEGTNLPNRGHLEKILGKKTGSYWRSEQDGSLRGESFEYVLGTPCDVSELEAMVNGLFTTLKNHKAKLDNSNRCSTHVHVNVAKERINVLTSIIVLWSTFESVFINWTGEERKNNHFCLSSNETRSTINAWNNLLKDGQHQMPEGIKYSSLNVLPLWRYGSFEFRIGRPAEEPTYVIKWARFLYYFVDFVKKNYTNPFNISYDLSERGPTEMLKAICEYYPEDTTLFEEFTKDFDGLDNKCMSSFRNVQHLVHSFPWDVWFTLIDREYIPNPFPAKNKVKNSRYTLINN
jgi:hypothetical protein